MFSAHPPVCVAVSGTELPWWQYQCLVEWGQALSNSIVVWEIAAPQKGVGKPRLRRHQGPPEERSVPIRALGLEVWREGGAPPGIQVVLDFTAGQTSRFLLPDPAPPVWAFRFGDSMDAKDLAYDELCRGQTTVEVTLAAWQYGGWRSLRHGCFRTVPESLAKTRTRILTRLTHWPRLAWTHPVAPDGTPAPAVERPSPNRSGSDAALWKALGKARVRALWRKLYQEMWSVAVVDRPVSAWLEGMPDALPWLPEPHRQEFLADPFLVDGPDGVPHLFAERYDYRQRRGWITTGPAGDDLPLEPAISHPTHLSYPHVFTVDDAYYCIPESFQERCIALYQVRRFPDRWKLCRFLVEDFAAVDSTVFYQAPWWWLLCGNHDTDPDGELWVWYAPELLGPWTPHPQNPVKIDPRSSRPAGRPFWHQGAWYRPAQDCSRTYGGALAINRLDCLTPERFQETVVQTLAPDPHGPYPAGLHTLNGWGTRSVVDGKRWAFRPTRLWRRLGQRWR